MCPTLKSGPIKSKEYRHRGIPKCKIQQKVNTPIPSFVMTLIQSAEIMCYLQTSNTVLHLSSHDNISYSSGFFLVFFARTIVSSLGMILPLPLLIGTHYTPIIKIDLCSNLLSLHTQLRTIFWPNSTHGPGWYLLAEKIIDHYSWRINIGSKNDISKHTRTSVFRYDFDLTWHGCSYDEDLTESRRAKWWTRRDIF